METCVNLNVAQCIKEWLMSGYLDYTHDIQIESHFPEKMSNASDLLKDARKNDKIRPSCFLFPQPPQPIEKCWMQWQHFHKAKQTSGKLKHEHFVLEIRMRLKIFAWTLLCVWFRIGNIETKWKRMEWEATIINSKRGRKKPEKLIKLSVLFRLLVNAIINGRCIQSDRTSG